MAPPKHPLSVLFGLLCLVSLGIACASKRQDNVEKRQGNVEIALFDGSGAVPRALESLEVGDSLSIRLGGLAPGAGVNVYLNDDERREWSYARVFADRRGNIGPTLLWYQSGVIGTTSRKIDFKPSPSFVTFEEAERYFARHSLSLTVKSLADGRILGQRQVRLAPRRSPLLYPSNAEGVLVNSMNVASEDLYVTGRNFPAGSVVQLLAVKNQYVWNLGDGLADVTGKDGSAEVETVRLEANQTRFTVKVWDHGNARPGAFDLVARIGREIGRLALRAEDVLSFNDDTGFLYFVIINGNIVIESAGRMKDAPAKFEFSDSFEMLENVFGAVDPTDVPAVHSGGNYAAYWVVEHQPESYWDGAVPALTDVSGGVEIHRVKYWCINMSRRLIWPNATQADPIKGYDVIVDFGATPAMDAAAFVADNTYNKGTDFIDGYDKVGFWVFENPGNAGTFPVGQVDLDEPNGISGITDPAGVTGPTQNVTLAWARIMYPATAAGTGTAVSGVLPSYPVALFLHGRHLSCDNDGAGPGLSGSFTCASAANRIPSHEGYNYILERLASQGIFTISISAHEIQPGLGVWDYDARGRLILKFLDKLKDWTDNGTDPFGGIFSGKLDMTKIALSGHSRGGEGVVAAQALNVTWPTPHSILAVNAIAPTDQNGVSYLMTAAPYYLLIGARDGDVSNMQGFRTYDRAFPEGAVNRHPKAIGWVYRANHNYFNTIWTDSAALGTPNPWAGSQDDGSGLVPAMTAADQRQAALTTVTAFFRRHLQGLEPYREIFTGRLKPASMPNAFVFWTYQDDERRAIDDFEQTPLDKTVNRVGGAATAPGFSTFEERLLNSGSTDYPAGFPIDFQFFHDTLGLKLAWATPQTYTTLILPGPTRDVSMYTHFTLRIAKKATGAVVAGPGVNLLVNLEDGTGKKALWDIRTDQFDLIPHPFEGSENPNQALMNGVRIPLRNFTQNNSGVNLTDIAKITIRTEGSGEIGIDDIEFGK